MADSGSGSTIERLSAADIDPTLVVNPPRDPRLALTPPLEEEMICLGLPAMIGSPDQPISLNNFLANRFVLTCKWSRDNRWRMTPMRKKCRSATP
ncbi:hypothetical protein [Paracoccus isoporae]|uniref:hypothetical protein n=1 Tax=Paracoccus isoporae TaxID=591205 RepID=UPI003CCC2F7E